MNSAVLRPPICKGPVGLGAKRTRVFIFFCKDSSLSVFRPDALHKYFIFAKRIVIIHFQHIPEFLDKEEISSLLEEFVLSYGFSIDTLHYNFVSQEKMLEINQNYLKHNTHTDIISFDYSSGQSLKAEFFVSMWAVALSAEDESQTIENETLRVLIHGVLHCMGYKDDTKDKKTIMRQLEDKFIHLYHVKQKKHV